MTCRIYLGDCLGVLRTMDDNSVDAIITDPPYGLKFMNKAWDYDVPTRGVWEACLRVLKPGGHLLSFAGTRTHHRMVVNIEDAGFEIRDMIAWVYGSGFPKGHNVLKPAFEPITLARKPISGTVIANIEKWGTGGLGIDASRIPIDPEIDDPRLGGAGTWSTEKMAKNVYEGGFAGIEVGSSPLGRWPANFIHDGSDEVVECFPEAPGQMAKAKNDGSDSSNVIYGKLKNVTARPEPREEKETSAARFFYCAKASKKDRGANNSHPTVKPTDLMRYLCKLITPAGGTILDPFMGSGSTGKAAVLEGYSFIGIEREVNYIGIAKTRIKAVMK